MADRTGVTDSKGSTLPVPPAAAPRPAVTIPCRAPGFTLIEVVVVILILAVVSAIAIPRLSRGSQGSAETALARDVQVMQKAIDLYAAEHNGTFPDGATVTHQLTMYSDIKGALSNTKAPPYEFGPYMRKIPAVPAGPNKGSNAIAAAAAPGVGWVYDQAEGTIVANTTDPAPTSAPASAPAN
jgi:general secretion pathway protein G